MLVSLAAACTFPNFKIDEPDEPGQAGSNNAGGVGGGAPAGGGEGAASGEPAAGSSGAGSSGAGNRLPNDCLAIRATTPEAASGVYVIDPDNEGEIEPFTTYCDMDTQDGGWTLLGSFTPGLGLLGEGLPKDPCYESPCINRAYSALPLGRDLRIDGSSTPITGTSYEVLVVVSDISEEARGQTLRAIFSAAAPIYVQGHVGPPLIVEFKNGASCATWKDLGGALCHTSFLVFQDPSGCDTDVFALGVAYDRSNPADTCDGWPQDPEQNFPQALRFWSR